VGFGGEARRDEMGQESTLQHAGTNRIGQGVCVVSLRAVDHDPVLVGRRRFFLPHSSSSSRLTAGAAGHSARWEKSQFRAQHDSLSLSPRS
jgi:hypothetical protein